MKEKSKFQRTINKKNEEHRNLLEEVGLLIRDFVMWKRSQIMARGIDFQIVNIVI